MGFSNLYIYLTEAKWGFIFISFDNGHSPVGIGLAAHHNIKIYIKEITIIAKQKYNYNKMLNMLYSPYLRKKQIYSYMAVLLAYLLKKFQLK